MRILVTGSSGHLGEALVRVLGFEGHEVVGLDVLPSPWTSVVASVADRLAVRVPRYDFRLVLARVAAGEDHRSELARTIGAKGYHATSTGPYTRR